MGNKEELKNENDNAILDLYTDFCHKEINLFLAAVRFNLNSTWDITDKKNPKNVLNPEVHQHR